MYASNKSSLEYSRTHVNFNMCHCYYFSAPQLSKVVWHKLHLVMVCQMPLDSGLKLLIKYFTIILTVSGKCMYLAQELLGLSEENTCVSEEEIQEYVSCLSCMGDLVDESEIAHFICDLWFDPQTLLPILELTLLLGECCAVCMQVHIWQPPTWTHV